MLALFISIMPLLVACCGEAAAGDFKRVVIHNAVDRRDTRRIIDHCTG